MSGFGFTKAYVPQALVSERQSPIFHMDDLQYILWTRDGVPVRASRLDPVTEECVAIYPTHVPRFYLFETFHDVDDNFPTKGIDDAEINDPVLTRLADGWDMRGVLHGYQHDMLGSLPSGSYVNREADRTFHVIEIDETKRGEPGVLVGCRTEPLRPW